MKQIYECIANDTPNQIKESHETDTQFELAYCIDCLVHSILSSDLT